MLLSEGGREAGVAEKCHSGLPWEGRKMEGDRKVEQECGNERPKDGQSGLIFCTAKGYTDNLVLNFQLHTSPTTFLCVCDVCCVWIHWPTFPEHGLERSQQGMCWVRTACTWTSVQEWRWKRRPRTGGLDCALRWKALKPLQSGLFSIRLDQLSTPL